MTVTGAPKLWAMQFCEDHERTPRRWYGGAIGCVTFDGAMNTGLTIRTIRMKDGLAEIRVGATLLWDSDPEAEDAECRIKAAALFQAIRRPAAAPAAQPAVPQTGAGKRLLLVDHDDSFVHTLADFFRQTGAEVAVVRHGRALAALEEGAPDLLVLSPGPGRPSDFAVGRTIERALAAGCRSSASASACRRWASISAAGWPSSRRRPMAVRAASGWRAGGSSTGCRRR